MQRDEEETEKKCEKKERGAGNKRREEKMKRMDSKWKEIGKEVRKRDGARKVKKE